MGQYHKIRCPICACNIETENPIDHCPACKEYIGDRLGASGDGTGINTARTSGEGLKPLLDLEQDVF